MQWTVDGRISCPAGHRSFDRPKQNKIGAPGAAYPGTLADFSESVTQEMIEKGCH
jgi:hypothetical protein